ncbi:ABC transporter ATP-binding protein [Nocardioides pyridinolyticus]
MNGEPAILTERLSKSYGQRAALVGVGLEVAPGQVFGYLGPNGAGKTTTIRLLAGLIRPTSGRAEVLGLDPVRQRDRVQAGIGYLPGDFVPYPDLTAAQYLRFLGRLRPGSDPALVVSLAERLDLALDGRIGSMSHGNRQKIGLVQALAHRPEVVILDEPTSGLDPIVQREFLELLRELRNEGRTAFLSSHVLSEVEAVADTVAFLRAGRLVVQASVRDLKARARHRLDLTFGGPVPADRLRSASGVRDLTVDGATARATVEGSTAALLEVAAPFRVERIVTHEADLEEIFLGYYQEGA